MVKNESKNFLYVDGDIKEKTFDDLHIDFYKMIQNEKWKMLRKYGKKLNASEVEQQFTIELWNAFEQYDIEKGVCISTYIFNKFKKARRDLIFESMLSKKSQFEKENVSHLQNSLNQEDETKDFSNREFEEDETYQQYKRMQPDILLEENELIRSLLNLAKMDWQKDLLLVLIDRKEYTVADYAQNYGISRMAANKRVNVMKEKIKSYLGDGK